MFSLIVPRIIIKKNYENINKYFYISKYYYIITSNLKKENIIKIAKNLDFLVSFIIINGRIFILILNVLLLMKKCVHINKIFVSSNIRKKNIKNLE